MGSSPCVMNLTHVELKEANAFVEKLHRHCKPITGHRFSIGAEKGGKLVGVAIIGRPVARKTCQRTIVEVSRLCTDGSKNACSFLYGAAARAAKALGYDKIQTFILEKEPGTSLRAAGWGLLGETSADTKGWTRGSRPRLEDPSPKGLKQKWGKTL